MDNDLAVLSPEKTVLTFRLAGLGSRIVAHIADVIVVITLIFIANLIFTSLAIRIMDQGLVIAALLVTSFLAPLLYFILFEGLWNGQTPGKKATGVRVMMADGTPITFVAALARNLLRPADMLPGPYLLGLVAIFSNPKAQRIGDLAAGTVVCYEKRTGQRVLPAPHNIGYHSYEPAVGELRGMTIEEYHALRRLADRFPYLEPGVQQRLMSEVFEPVAERRKVPALPGVDRLLVLEAVVMKYGRSHGML